MRYLTRLLVPSIAIMLTVSGCSKQDDDTTSKSNSSQQSSTQQHQKGGKGGKGGKGDKGGQQGQSSGASVNVALSKVCPQTVTLTTSTSATLYAQDETALQPKVSGYIVSVDVKEGAYVTKGTVIVKLDDKTQQAALAGTKVDVANAKKDLDRGKEIFKSNSLSQKDLDTLQQDYDLAVIAQQKAQIDLDNTQITAPFDGYVEQLTLSVGDYVTDTSTITTLVDAKKLRAVYTLPSSYLSQVKVGQQVDISLYNNEKTHEGKVSFIAKSVNSDTQTIALTAIVDNDDHLFAPGQDVDLVQTLGTQDNTLLVPRLILQTDIGTYSIYTVADNKAVQNNVTIGEQFGDNIEILSGIKANDLVVTSGMTQLRQGSAVTVTSTNSECNS